MAHLRALVVFDPLQKKTSADVSGVGSSAALRFGFERDGYTVHAPTSLADALAMAQAGTAVAQLVVVVLPGADEGSADDDDEDRTRALGVGYSLVARLREEPQTRHLPVVVLGDRGEREQALRAGADEFVARPAFIRDVITLSKLAVAARQDGDEGGVVGTLEDYQLYFLTRALAAAERSCVLELERGRRTGEVSFWKGQVCAARVGAGSHGIGMVGAAAFNHLLLWSEASMHLRFESPSVAAERKISMRVDQLLADGAKFAREFEALADRIGGAAAIYRQEPRRAASERGKIPPEVLQLLKIYDGRRPLIDVVEDSPFKPNDTIKITHRLHEMGVLERLSAPVATSPLTAALAVRDWLLGGQEGAPAKVEEQTATSTVTEAGRRAAEAYAEEEARRAATPAPGDDLLGDRGGVPRPIEDVPTAPREGERGPQARNKKRKGRRGDTGKTPRVSSPAASPPPVPATVPAPATVTSPANGTHAVAARGSDETEDDLTTPFMREPIEAPAKAREAKPAPVAAPPAPVAAPPASVAAPTAPVAAPPAPVAAKPAPAATRPAPVAAAPPPHPVPATAPKGSAARDKDPKPAARAAAAAVATKAPSLKEVAFTDEEEDFFARESELAKAEVDTFDDLEPSQPRSAPAKRRWFGLGPKFATPAPKSAPPKKR